MLNQLKSPNVSKQVVIVLILIISSNFLHAQNVILNGTIVFEKKVNMHKMMEASGGSWAENAKKNMPKYATSNFDLVFNRSQSIFKKSKEQPPSSGGGRMGMMRPDDDNNITYKNTDSNIIVAQKQIFEKLVRIDDSLPTITWKLSNEYKKIADMNCRKATAIIMDSVYLIAYYTDAIYTSSGPECVNGLPGMILGLVIPRMNTSYFATKITPSIDELDAEMIKPTKGEKFTYPKLIKQVSSSTEEWGKKWKGRIIWGIYL